MNKFIFLALIAIAVSELQDREIFTEFQKFTKKYEKKYNNLQEYMARFRVFAKNYKRMARSNNLWEGVTKFSDMTREEFSRVYLNLKFSFGNIQMDRVDAPRVQGPPESFDWREKGAVNAVKDQKSCGSCYAFASTANLEGLYFRRNNQSMTFSEQQIVDCDNIDQGCNGGLMENTFTWLKQYGMMSDKDYPYRGYEGTCKQDESKFILKIGGYNLLETKDEDHIRDFLYMNGPLAIAMNANMLQFYTGGVLEGDDYLCDPDSINHAITLVGWGVEGNTPYWICKNSWGVNWGEEGYFRIVRGKGACGINTYVCTAKLFY